MKNITCAVILVGLFALGNSFAERTVIDASKLQGAWKSVSGNEEQVIIFQDGYFMHTVFDKKNRKFFNSRGGTYSTDGQNLVFDIEFDVNNTNSIGSKETHSYSLKEKSLEIGSSAKTNFTQVDDGTGALAGNWRITGRKQGDKINRMQRGARKTLKILSGTRFQWAAINPESKEFFGTGGGTYNFQNGKYTETIEFFSRDSSRVGASLSFDGEVRENEWHHSGLSSKGDPIYEIWTREK
jgi:hypothetical protein